MFLLRRSFQLAMLKRLVTILPGIFFFNTAAFCQPKITSFSPSTGPVGTTVKIIGSAFNTTAANNIVYFGAVRATVVSSTFYNLTVIVPAGATHDPITITTNNLTGYSDKFFLVTFPDGDEVAAGSFTSPLEVDAGYTPVGMIASDLDGDGKPDLAVVNYSSNSVTLHRNTSTTSNPALVSATSLVTGTQPLEIASGDFDGDGKPDIAVINVGSFSVFLNTSTNGNISFSPRSDFTTGHKPGSICVSDLDGDGRPDIAISYSDFNTIAIFRNLSTPGTLSFGSEQVYMVPSSKSLAIAAADFDGDLKPELAVASHATGVVTVFKNVSYWSTIAFVSNPSFPVGLSGQTNSISVGDYDGDSKTDIAVANSALHKIFVLRNTSTTTQITFAASQDFKSGAWPIHLTSNDINGDGKTDLGVANYSPGSISVLKNTGTPGTVSFAPAVYFPSKPYVNAIVAVDLDADGEPDLATITAWDGHKVNVLRNIINDPVIDSVTTSNACIAPGSEVIISGKNFTGATTVSFDGTPAASFTVNSDNTITAIAASTANHNTTVATGNGSRIYMQQAPKLTGMSARNAPPGANVILSGRYLCGVTSVHFGGVNASSFSVTSDSTISVEVPAVSSGMVAVSSPRGSHSIHGFYNGTVINYITPGAAHAAAVIEISGTGFNTTPSANLVFFGGMKGEVLTATETTLSVRVPAGATDNYITVTANGFTSYSPRRFLVTFPGAINITEQSFNSKYDLSSPGGPVATIAVDLDADGKSDLAVANRQSDQVRLYKNTGRKGVIGSSSYTPEMTLAGNDPNDIATGDLNADGKPDLASISTYSGLQVFQNNTANGSFSFLSASVFPYDSSARDVIVHDLNKDGKPDIILSHQNYAILQFFFNIGSDKAFAFDRIFSKRTPGTVTHVSVADVDGDNWPDVVANDREHNAVLVLRNDSTNSEHFFDNPLSFPTTTEPVHVATGDLDGDGKPEILFTSFVNSTVSIFRNTTTDSISFTAAMHFPTGAGPVFLAVSDIDGDGKQDIVTANETAGTISVLKNTSAAGIISFNPQKEFTTGATPKHITIADVDADGKPDILVANEQSNTISIFRNKMADAAVMASGASPVTGVIIQRVTIDSTVQNKNGNPYVQRHYDIEPEENASTATATITLYFTQQEFNNYNAYPQHGLDLPKSPSDAIGKANLRVYQFHGFSTSSLPDSYNGGGVEINPDDSKIVWNAVAGWWEVTFDVNGFSGFFIGSAGNSILPLQLVTFSGSLQNEKAELSWQTSQEINVSHFEIQRSTDGVAYVTRGKVTARGTLTNNSYTFSEIAAFDPVYYYRIKIVDKDSSFNYSKIISLKPAAPVSSLITYPNPAEGWVTIRHPLSKNGTLHLIDVSGRTIKVIQVTENTAVTKVDLSGWSSGLYKLLYKDENKTISHSIIIR